MPRKDRDPADLIEYQGEMFYEATYTVEKNWILKTMAGTRCANVKLKIYSESPAHENIRRSDVQSYAMRKAVDVWMTRWGQLDWESAQFLVTHTTLEVVVELRVEPQ
jgi:hypothetical protein